MSQLNNPSPASIKIGVLGESVGKSCLIQRFLHSTFDGQHIKHNKMEKRYYRQINIMNEKFDLEITDTTNNFMDRHNDEKDGNVIEIRLKDIVDYSMNIRIEWMIQNDVLFLLFNRLNRISWRIVINIHALSMKYLTRNMINIKYVPIYMVSTCSDQYKSCNLQSIDLVTLKEIEEYAAQFSNTSHFETSSKLNQNIDALFQSAITQCMEMRVMKQQYIIEKRKQKSLNPPHKRPHKRAQSAQPTKTSMLRWFRAKSVSDKHVFHGSKKRRSKSPNTDLETPTLLMSSTSDRSDKVNATRRNKKEFKTLNKVYQSHSIDIKINDAQSSDDGDDIVLIDREHNMIGVATSQYTDDEKTTLNDHDGAMLPSHIMLPKPFPLDKTQSVPSIRSDKRKYSQRDTIYSGYLWKCGKIVKNWKLRYFIFCDDYQLRYYTASDLETCKGKADLTPANVVSVDIDRNSTEETGYPFIILCKNRTWKFRARSARERKQWVEMLISVVIKVKKNGLKLSKSARTLASADVDEDAMDIFGASNEQYLYTVNIFQAKNIARSKQLREPNVYISIEFNQCKSGNRYQTSIVYNCIDPVFNASIKELANKSEFDNITLSVYHRIDNNDDEIIGRVVIDIDAFNTWDRWIWMPIITQELNSISSPDVSFSEIKRNSGMIQLKLEYISLDNALMALQNKEWFEYSHIVCLHIHEFIPYDYQSSQEEVNHDELPPKTRFICPLLQIQWKYDEMYCTESASKVHDEEYNMDTYKWMESHYLYAMLRNDDKESDLIFNVLDDEIETGKDIIGEGKIEWKQLKIIEKNEMRTLKIPIFARRIIDDVYLSSQPMGYIRIDIEILSKKQILHQFYRKLLTLFWFKKMNKKAKVPHSMTFTGNEVYSILLSIGMHPSDTEHQQWIKSLNDASDDNDDDIHISIEDVIHLLIKQKYETSVSLNHYITAYLHFKNSKKFMNTNKLNLKSVNNILDNGWWTRFDRAPLFSADKDDLFVMDRKSGLRRREHVPGYLKIALKLMYDGWMGRIQTSNIEHHLDIFAANKSCKFEEKSSALMIGSFVGLHQINMNKYSPSNIAEYSTFNEFFSRDIKDSMSGSREHHNDNDDILSPCNGKMICFDKFADCALFWVKGSKFNVQRLVGDVMYDILLSHCEYDESKYCITNLNALKLENRVLYKRALKEFSSFFSISIFRLSPTDYHGYHYPFCGRVLSIKEIEGALYSVSPIVVNRDVNVLTENKRCCILFENKESFGFCVMIIIASFLIGSYSINCKVGQYIKCGDLMGKFKFGASAIILLFNKNRITFDKDLINNSLLRTRVETVVKLHEHIASIV